MITPASIPLALYVHLPWCAQKCPYCDFNSHEGFSPTLQQPYVDALLSDLDSQLNWLNGRPIGSIFIGGGTPSLFDGEWIAQLLAGIGDRLTLSRDAEITLESNPNSADAGHFKRYRRRASTGSALASRHFMTTHCSAWAGYTAAMKPGMLWTIFGALASIDGIST